MRRAIPVGVVLMSTFFPAAAASDGQLISIGYAAPAPIEVAPGQIVTLFLRGVGRMPDGSLRVAQARTVPLPETLAGLAASIDQLPQTVAYRLPLLSVRQHNECEDASGQPKCLLTAIRVQIPAELTPTVAKLTVAADGDSSRTFLVRPVRDDAHVLTTCDVTWDTNPGSDCVRMAFHADGTPVSEARPARRGESIIIYAHGLGPTMPRVPAGTAAPEGVRMVDAVARQLSVRFAAFRNAGSSVPRYFEAEPSGVEGTLEFAGLTAGQIGLYQMNIRVPESLEIPIACGADTRSNILAKVSTSRGIENLPLCVEP